MHSAQWLAILGTWLGPFFDYGDGHQEVDEVWDEHHSQDADVDLCDGEYVDVLYMYTSSFFYSVLRQLALYGLDTVVHNFTANVSFSRQNRPSVSHLYKRCNS